MYRSTGTSDPFVTVPSSSRLTSRHAFDVAAVDIPARPRPTRCSRRRRRVGVGRAKNRLPPEAFGGSTTTQGRTPDRSRCSWRPSRSRSPSFQDRRLFAAACSRTTSVGRARDVDPELAPRSSDSSSFGGAWGRTDHRLGTTRLPRRQPAMADVFFDVRRAVVERNREVPPIAQGQGGGGIASYSGWPPTARSRSGTTSRERPTRA